MREVDTKLMTAKILKKNIAKTPKAQVLAMTLLHVYTGRTEEKVRHSSNQLTDNMYHKIIHGMSLPVKNIKRKVPIESISGIILGRPVSQAIGCDSNQMLQAACEQLYCDIDVEMTMQIDGIGKA